MQTQAAQLGSGWSQALAAIEIALLDPKLVMLQEGLEALPQAITSAAEAGMSVPMLPQLLGLCALAATHEGHPHTCFAGLKCVQTIAAQLRSRNVGCTVRDPHAVSHVVARAAKKAHSSVCSVQHIARVMCRQNQRIAGPCSLLAGCHKRNCWRAIAARVAQCRKRHCHRHICQHESRACGHVSAARAHAMAVRAVCR
jgi:hypothetical protein